MTQMNPNMPAAAGVPTNGPVAGAGYEKLGDEVTGDHDSTADRTHGVNDDAVNDLVPDEVAEHNIDAPGTEDTRAEVADAESADVDRDGNALDDPLGNGNAADGDETALDDGAVGADSPDSPDSPASPASADEDDSGLASGEGRGADEAPLAGVGAEDDPDHDPEMPNIIKAPGVE